MTASLALAACGAQHGDTVTLPDDETVEQIVDTPDTTEKITGADPDYSEAEEDAILASYAHIDPTNIVPTQALKDALLYFNKNKAKFNNQNYISVINFAQSSKEKRFYIINIKSGAVWAIHVAHGKGSDSNHDGFAEKFSNVSGSNASSLGAYKAAETYTGSHGLSLRLDGLSATNSNARRRAVVIHGASYVQESNVIQGRSWGCPAVSMDNRDAVVKYLKGGSLIWAVTDKGGTGPVVKPTPTPAPTNPPASGYKVMDLAWTNSSYPERDAWSKYLVKLVMEDWNTLLAGSSDIKDFCPHYYELGSQDRANVWAQLVVAMAKYESGYKATSRMRETTMGIDPVTGSQVWSEGLLQLSYQDETGYTFCDFDWSQDRNLSGTDPKKTILDPYKNLHCGVGILARQVARKGSIKLSSGVYWAVLKVGGKYGKTNEIASMVRALPICQ
ncbi:murein L,D-transpeptidase catalytic domain family protein [Bdellovibrio bacteriovorus]|uniref:murein L,D-transpeptidase catalytic domain family protein n=1 Tax=Bdellovibrio bacteriovorus TaxID=959 RepID=UPI0020A606AD|nr:murein L,D-transpeptidase catalytic domain family protein [Bdellovibrio bacteriovorus]